LSSFENENIYQITFIDLNGEKERLIFDWLNEKNWYYKCNSWST
jgi:hypothetical protein